MRREILLRIALLGFGLLSGCVQPATSYNPSGVGSPSFSPQTSRTAPDIRLASETIELEHGDRIRRFARLSNLRGITAPSIAEMRVERGKVAGVDYAIPVVRVVFDERVFFDFNEDKIRPESQPVIDIMAENMRRDVPDARVLILGHTDSVGTDSYNIDLSRRRAANVMRMLVAAGVPAPELSTIPMGKYQPIAPNSTDEGRARNRRVEFMISASQEANLQVVRQRTVNSNFLKAHQSDPPVPASAPRVEVLTASIAPGSFELRPTGSIELQPPAIQTVEPKVVAPVPEVAAPAGSRVTLAVPKQPDIQVNRPTEYQKRELDNNFFVR